jgi:nucleotide-binding universal stress UspA family protein
MPSIIVPTDFSETTITALRIAGKLAKSTGFDLEVLHIHDGYGNSRELVVKKGNLAAQAEVQRRLDEFIRFNVTPGSDQTSVSDDVIDRLKIRTYIGDPGKELVRISKTEECALIVMGASGAGVRNSNSVFYGTVAQTVSVLGQCPVMLVPSGYDALDFKHISYSFRSKKDLESIYYKAEPFFRGLAPKVRVFGLIRFPRSVFWSA